MDSVMFGRPELMFKVKLKPYGEIRDDTMELPLIFFSAFERVALESDDKVHRMGNIIQLYEPGPDRQPGTGDGSKLYEVNMWMWNCGRGMPRPRTVSESERIRASHAAISRTKQHATRKRNRKDQ